MKALLTLIFILFIGFASVAQDAKPAVKVITVEVTVKVKEVKENNVARLYKYKNSKVTKALSFRTKSNRAKLA